MLKITVELNREHIRHLMKLIWSEETISELNYEISEGIISSPFNSDSHNTCVYNINMSQDSYMRLIGLLIDQIEFYSGNDKGRKINLTKNLAGIFVKGLLNNVKET